MNFKNYYTLLVILVLATMVLLLIHQNGLQFFKKSFIRKFQQLQSQAYAPDFLLEPKRNKSESSVAMVNNNRHLMSQDLEVIANETKLILIYTTWYGNPRWMGPSQAIDENKIFYTLNNPHFTCPKKCIYTHNVSYLGEAELVVASVVDLKNGPKIPSVRRPSQIWAAFICESPINQGLRYHIGGSNSLFNWSSSFRLDSDSYWPSGHFYKYPSPQARETFLKANAFPNSTMLKTKKLAAWVVSNCHTAGRRENIVKRLKKFMDIDIYGKCGMGCPKSGSCRQFISSKYKFYLAFENSLCLDYVTEKFYDPFDYFLVPITYGLGHYSKLAPPHSYINMLEFESLQKFVDYIHFLDKNDEEYLKYFEWRQNYTVLNDPTSSGLCNLCVKLWENGNKTKHYPDFTKWWETKPEGVKMDRIQEKFLGKSTFACSDIRQNHNDLLSYDPSLK